MCFYFLGCVLLMISSLFTIPTSCIWLCAVEWIHSSVHGRTGESPGCSAIPSWKWREPEHCYRGECVCLFKMTVASYIQYTIFWPEENSQYNQVIRILSVVTQMSVPYLRTVYPGKINASGARGKVMASTSLVHIPWESWRLYGSP